jgi:hypothetical protein
MNKDAYYDWIAENDTYPKHSHKWIVGLYNKYEGVEALHRYFGPFDTREDAKIFIQHYKEEYVKPDFITRSKIFPLCEVLWKDT